MTELKLEYWLKQLNFYAQDLAQLYQQERESRQKLAEEKIVLEYKLRELEALNKLLWKQIQDKQRLEKILFRLIGDLKELSSSSSDDIFIRLKELIAQIEDELAESYREKQ